MSYLDYAGLQRYHGLIDEKKANANGTCDNLTAGSSEALISDNYTLDTEPYVFRKGNGAREYEEIVGGSVGWNQLVKVNGSGNSTINGISFTWASDGTITANGTATADAVLYIDHDYTTLKGHKIFIGGCPSGGGSTSYGVQDVYNAGWVNIDVGNGKIVTANEHFFVAVRVVNGKTVSNVVFRPHAHDLTQLFGSTVADHLYSLEQATAGSGVALFKQMFPKSYYPYDAGSLLSVKTSGRKTVGFNQWDEVTELGGIDSTTGAETTGSKLRSAHYIPVIPNTAYYFKCPRMANSSYWAFGYDANKNYVGVCGSLYTAFSFTTQTNCHFIRIVLSADYGTTYNNDICINISGDRNGQYEPYTSHTYPMSNIDLRGVFKLADGKIYADGDVYPSSGGVSRRYTLLDLGTLSWSAISGYTGIFVAVSYDVKLVINTSLANAMCPKYTTVRGNDVATADKSIAVGVNNAYQIQIHDSAYTDATAFKNSLSGVMLVAEARTETTETADPYQHLQFVGSTEEFLDDRTVQVPVGHNSKYLEDLKAKIEGLPWDLSMIAPIENGTTASKAYAVGEYFLHNNQFCKAKTSIASGATFTLNTNYTVTTIGAELKSLA